MAIIWTINHVNIMEIKLVSWKKMPFFYYPLPRALNRMVFLISIGLETKPRKVFIDKEYLSNERIIKVRHCSSFSIKYKLITNSAFHYKSSTKYYKDNSCRKL